MADPKDLLDHAIKLLESSHGDIEYRNVIQQAYYSAYHAAAWFEEHLPVRSSLHRGEKSGSHDALLQRLERPAQELAYGLQTTSKYVATQMRIFKALRELATYDLKETIRIDQAEESIQMAKDIAEECSRGKR